MTKLRATACDSKPFVFWQTWDGPIDGLVIDEADEPAFQFGVCPLKIEGGALVARTVSEMAAFEAEYNTEQTMRSYAAKLDAVGTAVFVWSTWNFPMFATARLFYSCMQYKPSINYKVVDNTGALRNVDSPDVLAFLTAYYDKLTLLTQA